MLVFFGRGEYDSDALVGLCVERYLAFERSTLQSLSKHRNGSIVREGNGIKVKPHFLDSDLHFNLSHSNKVFAVAISKAEVGIDVEQVRELDLEKFQRIFRCETNSDFVKRWTNYEAMLKLKGEKVCAVLKGENAMLALQRQLENEGVTVQNLPIYDGFSMSVASTDNLVLMQVFDNLGNTL